MNRHITDKAWMKIVEFIAQFSTCRVKVGALIVQNNIIVATGYVGSVSGDEHCEDVGCLLVDNNKMYGSDNSGKSCIRTIHAEANAVLKCSARGNNNCNWLTLYSTYQPCLNCTKLLLSIGVTRICYQLGYVDKNRDIYLDSQNRGTVWVQIVGEKM